MSIWAKQINTCALFPISRLYLLYKYYLLEPGLHLAGEEMGKHASWVCGKILEGQIYDRIGMMA